MDAERETDGGSTLLSALFALITVMVFAAIGYATWIVVAYWGRVSV